MVLAPATAVIEPMVQVPPMFGVAATTMPVGKVSVKMLVRVIALALLLPSVIW